MSKPPLHLNPWGELRRHTAARIALGRAGDSLPTQEVLRFGLEHAQARDAVHLPLDLEKLQSDLHSDGWDSISVASRAPDRAAYLARPDWGRRLDEASTSRLAALNLAKPDLLFVIGDGLSSLAVQANAVPFLAALRPLLKNLSMGPVIIATQARVALADEAGELLGARMVVCLIGERPGLSSPDSLGVYVTHAPRVGRSDAERNCISNIRPQGLPYGAAALQLSALVQASLRAGLSGVKLQFDPSRALASG